MLDKIGGLLKISITEINNLQEYYLYQSTSVSKHVEDNFTKYIYGLALEFYFNDVIAKMEETRENSISFSPKIDISKIKEYFVDKILENYEIQKDGQEITITYKLKNVEKLDDKYELNPQLSRIKVNGLMQQSHILNKSILIMLLIKYEETIANIYRCLLEQFPQAYLNDKSITYSELILSSDIEQVKEKFIDKAVEEFMRLPLSDWYKTFSIKHNISFPCEITLTDFKEIYYRRNLIVHNQCRVNEIYIKNCNETNKKIGEELTVDNYYIENAFNTVLIMIYGTFLGLMKLVSNKCRADMISFIFEQGYEHMVKKQWYISKFIFEVLKQEKKQNAEEVLYSTVNYWISIKNSTGLEKIKHEIEAFDVSAMQGKFQVAKYALLDDFCNVSNSLEKTIDKEIPASYVAEWPLFLQYRESEEYKKFQQLHQELFKVQEYTPHDEPIDNEQEVLSELEKNIVE